MKKAILATKVGMTQIFNEDGTLTPVTVLQAGPCVVTQIKTVENDGYEAVQVGFVDKKDKTVNKDKNGKKEIVHRLKEKDSRVLLRDTTSTEDLWLTVLNSIVIRDLTVLHLIRVKYSKERRCQDTWEAKRLQFRILKLSV